MNPDTILNAIVTIIVALGSGSGLLVALLRKGHVTTEQVAKASEADVDGLKLAMSLQKRVEKLEHSNDIMERDLTQFQSTMSRVVDMLSRRPPEDQSKILSYILQHFPDFGRNRHEPDDPQG